MLPLPAPRLCNPYTSPQRLLPDPVGIPRSQLNPAGKDCAESSQPPLPARVCPHRIQDGNQRTLFMLIL